MKKISVYTLMLSWLLGFQISIAGKYSYKEFKSAEAEVLLLSNSTRLVPFKKLGRKKIALLNIGCNKSLDSVASFYAPLSIFRSPNRFPKKSYNTFIVGITDKDVSNTKVTHLINNLPQTDLVIVFSGSVDSLVRLDSISCPVVYCKKNQAAHMSVAAQTIFGGIGAPKTANLFDSDSTFEYKTFATTPIRLKYTFPEELGLNEKKLAGIDTIAWEALNAKATPGMVVLVAKAGKVIFHKSYGYQTYTKDAPISVNNIFDLASITKIAATTPVAMKMYEEGDISLNEAIHKYIPEMKGTNKEAITLKQLLLHEGGLVPFIPFHKHLQFSDWNRETDELYSVQVADRFYVRNDYFPKTMWPKMIHSEVKPTGKYAYSDLSMYFLKAIIENQSGEEMQAIAERTFYNPLGLQTMGFNPNKRFPRSRISPTEIDSTFRKQMVHGFVHDQGAALAGGISGHAGLFSTANDLAILFQMFLNNGSYGDDRYFDPETIALFTSRQSTTSRRGLGFDKCEIDGKSYPCQLASKSVYGHTGFTGTCIWVDPEYDLIYVFLSNRTFPNTSIRLNSLSIRGRIQDKVYESILEARQK